MKTAVRDVSIDAHRAHMARQVLVETPLRRCAETGRSAHGLQLAAVQGEMFL